jgi:NAD-dependent dihydropyrimidine dehydrogenase PreA subunit
MIESIEQSLCNGCGICLNSCCMDVIRIDKKAKKAVILYPEDCCSCSLCKVDCPQHCIEVSWRTPAAPTTMWGR